MRMERPESEQHEAEAAREAAGAPSPPPTNLTDVALDDAGGRKTPLPAAQQQAEDEPAEALPTHNAAPAIYQLPGGMEVSEAAPLGQLLTKLRWASERCIEGMDRVGGAVAGFLGVTDSRFQYVLDHMSEEDVAAAEAELRHSRNEAPLLLEEIAAQQHQQQQGGSAVELAEAAAGGSV